MRSVVPRTLAAIVFAAIMIVPTSAVAADVVVSEQEAEEAEIADFVAGWTAAMLSRDDAVLAAMPGEEAYADWDHEKQVAAIGGLFESLENNRPADAEPITDEAEIAFVKGVLHGFIFARSAFEAAAQEQQASIEALTQATDERTMEENALDYDREILETSAPHQAHLERLLDQFASVHATPEQLLLPDVGINAALPGEVDPVFEQLDPLLASAAGMSATGTYMLHVVAGGQDYTVQNVPFGVVVPLDADLDGTTGLGGVDITAVVNVQGTPAAAYGLEDGVLALTAGGVGPALTIERVGDGARETPDFQPLDAIFVEALVPLENGLQVARIGFDTTETGVPAMARVTLVPAVEAASGAPGAIASVTGTDELQGDARAVADEAAGALGAELPWSDVDALPGEAEAQADALQQEADAQASPARAMAEELQAQAEATVDPVVDEQLPAFVAELEGEVAPVVAAAEETLVETQQASEPAVAIVDESVGFYQDLAESTAQPVADAAEATLVDVREAAFPATSLVDETVTFYQERADATLADARAALEATRADAYSTIVAANGQVGVAKNEYVYGDGLTSQLPQTGAAPPEVSTPFDDDLVQVQDGIGATAESTSVRVPPAFALAVESADAPGDLVVVGGFATREDTADAFEDDATLVLSFAPAPTLLTMTVAPTGHEGAKLGIATTTPTTLSALMAMRAGERVSAAGIVLGELPEKVDFTFARSSVDYVATANMDIMGFFAYAFGSHDDFVTWIEGGAFTGRYAHAIAADLPTSFSLTYDDAAGTVGYTSEGGRLGGIEFLTADFAQDALVGYMVRGALFDLPTSFTLAADGSAAAFDASEPLGAIEFERTNGARLVDAPAAFMVAYRNGAADLVHLRILGIQRLSYVDEIITVDLAGGYPVMFDLTDGAQRIFGSITNMPNHLRFGLDRDDAAQTLDITALPSGFGFWAGMRSPSLGVDTAVFGINDLAGHVVATVEAATPKVSWQASRTTGGIFAGLYDAANAPKAALSFGQIPPSMNIEVDQFSQGYPRLLYAASQNTLDASLYVTGELLAGVGSVYMALADIPRNGLGFSVLGNAYSIWSNGPERLGRWYMDVAGLNFAVSPISFHQRWVDNWILQVGADVEFAANIQIRHFYLLIDNLWTMSVNVAAPTLQVSVNGVLQMAFDTLMYSTGYASIYAKVLWGWICLICIYVDANRAGWVPVNFHSWGYAWNVWRWNYISYPVGFCSWTSIKIEDRWVEVGLRLPAGFTTHWNGYSLSYGSANLFVNPGQLIPTNLVWIYAAATGFDAYFREYTTHHCT